MKPSNDRTGSEHRSGSTATKCRSLPMSIPAQSGFTTFNRCVLPLLRAMQESSQASLRCGRGGTTAKFQSLERGRGNPAPSVTEAEHGSGHTGKRVLSHSTEITASSTPTVPSSCHRRRRHKPPLLPRRSGRGAGVVTGNDSGHALSSGAWRFATRLLARTWRWLRVTMISARPPRQPRHARRATCDRCMSGNGRGRTEARDEKRLLRLQAQFARVNLLIVDELGYVPLSQTGSELLFDVFSRRYENGATIVTSNLPFQEWTTVFASERLTGALLDRITHHVHILEMNGETYRLKQSRPRRRQPSE